MGRKKYKLEKHEGPNGTFWYYYCTANPLIGGSNEVKAVAIKEAESVCPEVHRIIQNEMVKPAPISPTHSERTSSLNKIVLRSSMADFQIIIS